MIAARSQKQSGGRQGPVTVFLAAKALELVAGWPATSAEEVLRSLLAEIDRRIDATEDPDERSRLERFRDFVTGAGRDVVVSVVTTYITQQAERLG